MFLFNHLFDFFLPRFCLSCNSKLNPDTIYICEPCCNLIQRADSKRIELEFNRKFESGKIISGFISAFVFEKEKPLQHLIHSLKYMENFRIGIFLGKMSGTLLKEEIKSWDGDLLIPVPLHRLKKAERGYNQSYYIAKGISSVTKIPVEESVMKRKRFTETQTELTLEERKDNIRSAFTVSGNKKIAGKNIILVDDVITTGATISECGSVLKENGAAEIFALSVAVAD